MPQRFSTLRFKMMLTYLSIMMVLMVFINYYPNIVALDFITSARREEMMNTAYSLSNTLSRSFDTDYAALEERIVGLSSSERFVVTDGEANVLYDNAENDNFIGKKAVSAEIYSALSGEDMFACRRGNRSFTFSACVAVERGGVLLGSVYLSRVSADEALMLARTQRQILIFSIVIGTLVLLLSFFFSLVLTRRTGELMKGVGAIREGDYDVRVPVEDDDELSRLAGAFNDLSERMQLTEQTRREFVSNASHELKTPLASIKLLVESIIDAPSMEKDMLQSFLGDINHEIDRLVRITERLLTLTRVDSGITSPFVSVDAGEETRAAVRSIHPIAQAAGVDVRLYAEDGCIISGPRDAYSQIVYNLVDNAVKYNRRGGAVTVRLWKRDGFIILRVRDNGPGIPEKDIDRIFERFYRVDKARSRESGGTGLGLSIVKSNVELLGGQIDVHSVVDEGTAFTAVFPCAGENREDGSGTGVGGTQTRA